MAVIKLNNRFQLIPEGEYLFEVVETNFNEEFGKLKLKLKCEKGTAFKDFQVYDAHGKPNDKVMGVFSWFARELMANDEDDVEVDPEEFTGRKLYMTVTHNEVPKKDDPTQTTTFLNLGGFRRYEGGVVEKPKTSSGKSLADLLGE